MVNIQLTQEEANTIYAALQCSKKSLQQTIKRHTAEEKIQELKVDQTAYSEISKCMRLIEAAAFGGANEPYNFYFTFGSSEDFPYQNGYLIVKAETIREAAYKFMMQYPNRDGSDCLNCSDYYDQRRWDEITKAGYYKDEEPKEIIE